MSTERKYPLPGGAWFTNSDVEAALDAYRDGGLISSWRRGPHSLNSQSGTRAYPLYIAVLTNGGELHMATAWEAYAFTVGLAAYWRAAEGAPDDEPGHGHHEAGDL